MNAKWTSSRYFPVLMAVSMLLGCSSQAAQPAAPPPAKSPDRFIYISSAGLADQCYHDLGPIRLQVPYADVAVDPDSIQMNQRLRAAALEQYAQTDAVIRVQSVQNSVGTVVIFTGEAVELEQHNTVECTLRGAPKVADAAAVLAVGGVAGTVVGGLATGVSGAVGGAALGIGAMGAYQTVQHLNNEQAQQNALQQRLDEQRQQIATLIGERNRLRQCQADELNYKDCLAAKPIIVTSGPAPEDAPNPAGTSATPFELERQLQEQQVYIKRLDGEISNLKFQMGG